MKVYLSSRQGITDRAEVEEESNKERVKAAKYDEEIIVNWFAENLKPVLRKALANSDCKKNLEEIRLRIKQPLLLRTAQNEYFIRSNGQIGNSEESYKVSREDLLLTLERMTFSSIYAAEENLRQGFLTLPGGHRVGITGELIVEKNEARSLKNISALNVRIANEPQSSVLDLLVNLLDSKGRFCDTLLLSPPRAGKTTILRMLIQHLSRGVPFLGLEGQTIGVVDERGEIAGMWQGIPAFDLGCRTDIIDRSPKFIGISMLIRSMSPSIIAVDELGSPDDVGALEEAVRCGVKILATAHADSLEEALKRPSLSKLFARRTFKRVVILSRSKGPGTVEEVIDMEKGFTVPIQTKPEQILKAR